MNAEVPIQLTGQECGCACSVIYDGKHKEFILVPGEVSLVYLNGQLLSEPQLLADGDQMCVGEEQLCFQSFAENIGSGHWRHIFAGSIQWDDALCKSAVTRYRGT